eukprot:CAMPEP_0170198574 /NCGR_PEP_ID=MMETSP0040_2-20121228/68852_1 /TAXON_ID=641309 /ORGANISM="Lotharella oceanica, Strain CCMP622" /LENGTH=345 /DNA_ID=CAMNT_0010448585 /DNA_START=87 /DNA_END=1121 /DNA_ORIENTATION=-
MKASKVPETRSKKPTWQRVCMGVSEGEALPAPRAPYRSFSTTKEKDLKLIEDAAASPTMPIFLSPSRRPKLAKLNVQKSESSLSSYSSERDVPDAKIRKQENNKSERAIDNLLFEIYGAYTGRPPATEEDKKCAEDAGTSLTYGEITVEGVQKMMDDNHLGVASAKTLLDIGSGCGKLVHQCFDSYDLDKVIGVEISALRYSRSYEASKAYVACVNKYSRNHYAVLSEITQGYTGHRVEVHRLQHKGRETCVRTSVLEIYNCNIGLLGGIIAEASPQVVVMDVMHMTLSKEITGVLNSLPFGTRIATFERIDERWPRSHRFPFLQTNLGEGYRTTWSEDHKFYLW